MNRFEWFVPNLSFLAVTFTFKPETLESQSKAKDSYFSLVSSNNLSETLPFVVGPRAW